MISAGSRLCRPNTDCTRAAGSSGPPTQSGVSSRAQTSQVTSAAMPASSAVPRSAV